MPVVTTRKVFQDEDRVFAREVIIRTTSWSFAEIAAELKLPADIEISRHLQIDYGDYESARKPSLTDYAFEIEEYFDKDGKPLTRKVTQRLRTITENIVTWE